MGINYTEMYPYISDLEYKNMPTNYSEMLPYIDEEFNFDEYCTYVVDELLLKRLKEKEIKYQTSHLVHLIFTLLTLGLWAFIWVFVGFYNHDKYKKECKKMQELCRFIENHNGLESFINNSKYGKDSVNHFDANIIDDETLKIMLQELHHIDSRIEEADKDKIEPLKNLRNELLLAM